VLGGGDLAEGWEYGGGWKEGPNKKSGAEQGGLLISSSECHKGLWGGKSQAMYRTEEKKVWDNTGITSKGGKGNSPVCYNKGYQLITCAESRWRGKSGW